MSTFRASNNNETCKNCQVGGDGYACQTYKITDLRGDRGSAVGYTITGNNFDSFISEWGFSDNKCSQDAITALKNEIGVKLGEAFDNFIYKKPYVTLNEGDEFEVCALIAATVTIHDGCCEDKPPEVSLTTSETNVSKK